MTPTPGTLATYHAGSDRYAMVVVDVQRNGRLLLVDRLDRVVDEYGDDFTDEDLEAHVARGLAAESRANFGQAFRRFTLRTDGTYRAQGAPVRGFVLTLGKADSYLDPSF